MRTTILIAALLSACAPAHAGDERISTPEREPEAKEWNPPARYDKPFPGKMYVYRFPPERVAQECRSLFAKAGLEIFVWPTQVGCAAVQDDICVVYIRDREVDGITPEAILNHERGHCNGWPADHLQPKNL